MTQLQSARTYVLSLLALSVWAQYPVAHADDLDLVLDQRARAYDHYLQAIGMRESLSSSRDVELKREIIGPAEIEFQRTKENELEKSLTAHGLKRGEVSDAPVPETKESDEALASESKNPGTGSSASKGRSANRALSSGEQSEVEAPPVQLDANGVAPEIEFKGSKKKAK